MQVSRRLVATAMILAFVFSPALEAAKPVQTPAATMFAFFANGKGKVPKNLSTALGILKAINPPVYYCYFAFHNFSKQGKSSGKITVVHNNAAGTTERSPTLGGKLQQNFLQSSVFERDVSQIKLEKGSVVEIRGKQSGWNGKLAETGALQVEVYDRNPLITASAEERGYASGQSASAVSFAKMRVIPTE